MKKGVKVWNLILILLVVGAVSPGLIDVTCATSEKTTISATDSSPWFTKGNSVGYWHSYTYSGHTFVWTYVGGMSGNPLQPDCWAEIRPYLSQSDEYDVYACFYADPTQSTQVPYL
ncbi:MAG TPA: hypothetical protein VMW67_03605 [Desulfobacteria bacterium]|nr:hypothetical protein [Desulfobacteria bacterium]